MKPPSNSNHLTLYETSNNTCHIDHKNYNFSKFCPVCGMECDITKATGDSDIAKTNFDQQRVTKINKMSSSNNCLAKENHIVNNKLHDLVNGLKTLSPIKDQTNYDNKNDKYLISDSRDKFLQSDNKDKFVTNKYMRQPSPEIAHIAYEIDYKKSKNSIGAGRYSPSTEILQSPAGDTSTRSISGYSHMSPLSSNSISFIENKSNHIKTRPYSSSPRKNDILHLNSDYAKQMDYQFLKINNSKQQESSSVFCKLLNKSPTQRCIEHDHAACYQLRETHIVNQHEIIKDDTKVIENDSSIIKIDPSSAMKTNCSTLIKPNKNILEFVNDKQQIVKESFDLMRKVDKFLEDKRNERAQYLKDKKQQFQASYLKISNDLASRLNNSDDIKHEKKLISIRTKSLSPTPVQENCLQLPRIAPRRLRSDSETYDFSMINENHKKFRDKSPLSFLETMICDPINENVFTNSSNQNDDSTNSSSSSSNSQNVINSSSTNVETNNCCHRSTKSSDTEIIDNNSTKCNQKSVVATAACQRAKARLLKKKTVSKQTVPKKAETEDVSDTSESESEFLDSDHHEDESISKELPLSVTNVDDNNFKVVQHDFVLRPSLFQHMAPYIYFAPHTEIQPKKIPTSVQRQLKWRLSTITPLIVRKVLTNSGFRLVRSESDFFEEFYFAKYPESNDWIGIWGKHIKSPMFRTLKEHQKLNHFPGTFQIGRKDRLWRNAHKFQNKFGNKEFGFIPKTFVLPSDLRSLRHTWETIEPDSKWILKPPASARGTGIRVINRWVQIPKKKPIIVQNYIDRPLLINGSKFDIRLYVLVTSFNPIRIYIYPDGLARFASVKYTSDANALENRYMHLTNYSINKFSMQYTVNEDANKAQGHKWTLKKLWEYLTIDKNINTQTLWQSLKDLVIKTMLCGESGIVPLMRANVASRYNCYELFGIDVLFDENLKPWLLEVNISPSLHSHSPLDCFVKGPLVTDLLNLAQYHLPFDKFTAVQRKIIIDKMRNSNHLKSAEQILPNCDISYNPLTEDMPLSLDWRLYSIVLSPEEKAKQEEISEYEHREDYLDDILENLLPDDIRHLILAEDELQVVGGFEKIFPTNDTHSYLNYCETPRYYDRLFDAWETKYHRNRHEGIKLLREFCEKKYHLIVPPQVRPPNKPSLTNQSMKQQSTSATQTEILKSNNLETFSDLVNSEISNKENDDEQNP